MNDPAILFVKPKALKPSDKKALKDAGIIVIEVEDPSAIKFTRAQAELSSTDLLRAAARGLSAGGYQASEAFAKAIYAIILGTPAPK